MVCAQVIGNDAAVTAAGASGSFELNVVMPVMARNLLESVRLLAAASRLLAERCVDGITADAERMRQYAESSPSVVTPLNKYVGYEAAAKIAKQALAEGATIRETVIAMGYVERGELTEAAARRGARRGVDDPPLSRRGLMSLGTGRMRCSAGVRDRLGIEGQLSTSRATRSGPRRRTGCRSGPGCSPGPS